MSAESMVQQPPGLKGPLVWSMVLHSLLFGSLAVSTILSHRGDLWGGPGGGGAVSVKLVGGLSGVPLPRPETVTTNRVVDETKGLYKSEPQPKPKAPPPDTKQIPEFTKEKQPRYVTRPSKTLEDPTPPPQNAVPYGQGGSPRGALHAIRHGSWRSHQRGHGLQRARRRRVCRALFLVRNRGAKSREQQLAAKHRRSFAPMGAPRGSELRYFAERRRRQRSGFAVERERLGGCVGGTRDHGIESDECAAE